MPVTQSLNSKANVKKQTNQDLPFAPQQPVMSSYYAVSTASQTVINLSFSVDTVNQPDQFWLFVDGKKLRLGSTNDYTFTAIGSNGYSSQITLNSPININLNIQAFLLGLKKEAEFAMDNRFVQLYEAQGNSFQAVINQTSLMSATSTTGTPAAGTFYSSITNRASITDLSSNLKAQIGFDRMPVPGAYQIQGEFGPNLEPIYGVIGDIFGQIRFGGAILSSGDASGAGVSFAVLNDFMEVTFYGTGLNIGFQTYSVANDFRVSVDGGAEGSNIWTGTTYSSALTNRNYDTFQGINVASGLTLGVHTVKIRANSATAAARVQSIEVITVNTTAANVQVNPGIAYIQGKKYTTASAVTFAYNAGITGTKGGRTLVYQNGDGTIGTAFQAVDATSLTFTNTNHQNEEIAQIVHFREFGSSRSDDFMSLGSSAANKAFTLSDNLTTLSSLNGIIDPNIGEALSVLSGTANFTLLVFIGTGIDVMLQQTATGFTRSMTYSIDGGASIGTTTYTTTQNPVWVKLASGLPYGTHTLKLSNGSASLNAPGIVKFAIYQPKKPTLPSGTVELADFNNFANYDGTTATSTTDNTQMPTGVLLKSPVREFTYTGAGWSIIGVDNASTTGNTSNSGTNGDNVNFTFFGTGFNISMWGQSGGTYAYSVTVDGALNSTGVARSNMVNSGSGIYTSTTTTARAPCRVEFTGLTLGFHTVTIAKTSGTPGIQIQNINIITPIHAYKFANNDIMNSTLVGSQSISDNRNTTAVINAPTPKAWAQATGQSVSPSTSSATYVPMPDMMVKIKIKGNRVRISYNVQMTSNGSNGVNTALFIDGVQVFDAQGVTATTAAYSPFDGIFNLSPGTHTIAVYWRSPASSAVSTAAQSRILTVEEQ
jgi:hypothetical protein